MRTHCGSERLTTGPSVRSDHSLIGLRPSRATFRSFVHSQARGNRSRRFHSDSAHSLAEVVDRRGRSAETAAAELVSRIKKRHTPFSLAQVHYGPKYPRIQIKGLGHSLIRLINRFHVCLLRTDTFCSRTPLTRFLPHLRGSE